MTATEYIEIVHRELPFPTFDSDNHLYENEDALTKFLPSEYRGVVRYVDVGGRTKLAIQDRISDYIPNPTFSRVAVPGGAGYDVTKGGSGFGDLTGFGKMVAMPSIDVAISELEWIAEHGAKIFAIRVAPVPTWKGRKSFALAEFDPFWERAQELDLVVGMHSGDAGYSRYTNEWEGLGDREFVITAKSKARQTSPAFIALSSEKDPLIDAMASIIGHGLATRFPRLRFMPVEYATDWIRPFYRKLQRTYEQVPVLFDENPVEAFTRTVWVHAFHEPEPEGLIELGIPVDHIMFGSDFPHPEGMADPLAYAAVVAGLPLEQQELIMGGSLERAMKVGRYA